MNMLNAIKLNLQMMIIIGSALVGFIVVGAIYFVNSTTQSSLQHKQLNATENVAAVKALQIGFLLERRNEKDFLLRSKSKYVERHA